MPMPTTPKPPHHPRGEKIIQMLNGVNTRCALYGHAACSGWRRAFKCARRRRFPPARLALPPGNGTPICRPTDRVLMGAVAFGWSRLEHVPTTPKPPHHPRGEKIVQMLNGENTRCALYGQCGR
uniref:Uncharacterized protein n=1 Tax=Globodera rostochiensis TaxID=31243 RepID=A0A914HTU0_GLORO